MSFVVMFVCTGNICRSPMAERLLLSRLNGRADGVALRVHSAGTSGLSGWPMDAPSAMALRELGGDSAGHVAQLLTRELVAEADLILTAERGHRELILRTDPAAAARTFTMREFARLGGELASAPGDRSGDGLRERVAAVAARRRAVSFAAHRDDIGDPYGASMAFVRSCAAQIAEAVDGVLAALGLATLPSTLPPG